MKTTIVGHSNGADVASEGNILNRMIRATSAGWEYACDRRHVEVFIEELELTSLKSASTPGVAEAVEKSEVGATMINDDPDLVPLVGESATRYRALAARCNYSAVDRADAQDCTKELCRDTSSPTVASWKRLVRLGRYFLGKPRAVKFVDWQSEATCFDIYTDANWAGCHNTR